MTERDRDRDRVTEELRTTEAISSKRLERTDFKLTGV